MTSNTGVGGIRARATSRCGARMIRSPAALRFSAGRWLLTKKPDVNS